MTYATQADLTDRFGAVELAQLTDRASGLVIDRAVLERANLLIGHGRAWLRIHRGIELAGANGAVDRRSHGLRDGLLDLEVERGPSLNVEDDLILKLVVAEREERIEGNVLGRRNGNGHPRHEDGAQRGLVNGKNAEIELEFSAHPAIGPLRTVPRSVDNAIALIVSLINLEKRGSDTALGSSGDLLKGSHRLLHEVVTLREALDLDIGKLVLAQEEFGGLEVLQVAREDQVGAADVLDSAVEWLAGVEDDFNSVSAVEAGAVEELEPGRLPAVVAHSAREGFLKAELASLLVEREVLGRVKEDQAARILNEVGVERLLRAHIEVNGAIRNEGLVAEDGLFLALFLDINAVLARLTPLVNLEFLRLPVGERAGDNTLVVLEVLYRSVGRGAGRADDCGLKIGCVH